jgi:hypothetical protein
VAIEKNPHLGVTGLPEEEQIPLDLEILDDPENGLTVNKDGTVEIDLDKSPAPSKEGMQHDSNLVTFLNEEQLRTLASDLLEDVEEDIRSRADWEKKYKDGLRLLGLNVEPRTVPWDGACGVVHPIMAEAVVRFQAEMITETFPPHGPVKTKVIGKKSTAKEEAAARVREDMNHELTDRMTEYRAEHERLLWNLPLAGSGFKKVYYDPTLGRQASMFVDAENFIVSYGASDLMTATRYTHRMKKTKNELKKLISAGFYRDVLEKMTDPTSSLQEVTDEKDKISGQTVLSESEHYTIYEVNVDLDLPGFEDSLGIALPYVVTIDKDSEQVLSIYRNWKEDDAQRLKQQYFIHYTYIPGFGFYGFGLIHLVGGFAESATSILRQLVDAGTLSNLPGGLKTRGLRIKGDDSPIGPGEWRDVDVPGGNLKENLLPLPYKEPSAVLAQLLEKIVEEGRKFAAVAEMKVADFDSNSPVGTTMALLERTLKVMSSVQARVYEAMKLEFRQIKKLIRDHGSDVYEYEPETGDASLKGSDYETTDVLPVADPNAATMSQRIVQWQAVMQLASTAPQIYDLPQLHHEMLTILGVKNLEKLIPSLQINQSPVDPVSENMAILVGKPVKAFIQQDHKSHIQVHMMAMQDPKIMQLVGQNPMAPQIQAAAMAHVMEHIAFEYRAQMEQMLGVTLPPPDQPQDPELEVQLSALVAQAAPKLLGLNQQEAAAQAAQAAAQDPVLAQQMREAEIKDKKVEYDNANKQEELRIREKEVDIEAAAKGVELGSNIMLEKEKLEAQRESQQNQIASAERQTGFKSAVDLTKQDRDREEREKDRQTQVADKFADRQHKSEESDKQRVDNTVEKQADRDHQSQESAAEREARERQAKAAVKNKPSGDKK